MLKVEEFPPRRKDTVSSKRSGAAAPTKRESPQSFQQIKDVDAERKYAGGLRKNTTIKDVKEAEKAPSGVLGPETSGKRLENSTRKTVSRTVISLCCFLVCF
ncbi:hypothetical protein G5714_002617 [Onychostoma macrolepis]|uniref:Uncharacterized protein n=1 Tax=Onychostoma macrolepis TaxID=369639 RepID=A0A7J6D769_9TELE|nr:hypothetical protein G5714_002617 [Onychostoma macrolepis]